MKKYFYFLAVAIIATLSTSCTATKSTVPGDNGAVNVRIPLSGKEYSSNNEYWRAKSSGKSDDMSMAQKVAMQNTRQGLAANIEAEVKAFMENYGQNHSEKAKSIYEELGTTVVKHTLRNIEVAGEECLYQNGTYEYHICLQISKLQVMKELEERLAQEDELKLEFDRERFRERRDAEFQKFVEER